MDIFDLSTANNLRNSYKNYLNDLRKDAMSDDDTNLLSEDFIFEFKKIINSSDLDEYNPKNFFWLNLIDQLVDTLDVTEGMLEGELMVEDAIDFLEGSEFLGLFLESDSDPEENLKDILEIQELQIVSFFWIHVNQSRDWEPQGPVAYRPIGEMGEGEGRLYLGHKHVPFLYPKDSLPNALPVIAYLPKSEQIIFDNEGETIESYIQDGLKISFKLDHKKITVIGDLTHAEKFKDAFKRLEKCHPKLYEFLFTFTNTIVPIQEDGIVSYSMDTLPGHSSINTFDRDFVDLLDDLVHENGHHYLNAMIEGEDNLIIEDEDKIFYSPWRRALRPIRGLYHGVCTFFWAFELFRELRKFDDLFTNEEMIKIHQRFLEEGHMILKCKEQVDLGLKMDKITKVGFDLAMSFINNVDSHQESLRNSEKYLKENCESTYKELCDSRDAIDAAQESFKTND